VLDRMPDIVSEVILVDGRSVDGTIAAARAALPWITVIGQGRAGKGNALAAGLEAATGDYIVMIDADGSMDPEEINAFVEALEGGADYAKGSRFTEGGGSDDISQLRKAGNWALNAITNVLFRTRYSDLCYGYNAFRRECVGVFDLESGQATGRGRWGDGFEIETILNTRVAKARLSIAEVPSFEYRRLHGESNLNTFRDGARVLLAILRERFGRDRRGRVPAQAQLGAATAATAPTGIAAVARDRIGG
jgi:glycosyltransferase involved in cell wall biosynthesis